MLRSALSLSLATVMATTVQAAPRKKVAAKKPVLTASKTARASFSLDPGVVKIMQPLKRGADGIAPATALAIREIPSSAVWRRNASLESEEMPLFPAGPLDSSDAAWKPGSSLPEAPVFTDDGEVRYQPARWLTVQSGGSALTLPVGERKAIPPVQITPQVPGSLVTLGQKLPLAVTLTNLSSSMSDWTCEYQAKTAAGQPISSGSFQIAVPGMYRVTTPLSVGPLGIPGSITVTVTAKNGASVVGSATSGGGAITTHNSIRTGEFPFGLSGGDALMAKAAGTQFWASGWPWWNPAQSTACYGAKSDPAPGSAEGVFSLADKLDVSIISRAYAESPDASKRFAPDAMQRFIRRAGGWSLAYSSDMTPADYAASLGAYFAASKSVHKDAITFLELPPAAKDGLDVGRAAGEAGAEDATDTLAIRGIGISPASDSFDSSLQGLLQLRDDEFPAREIWNMGESIDFAPSVSPIAQAGQVVRSAVEQLAAGVDKVFWSAKSGLLNDDGSAAPAFFGLSSLTETLAGAEYLGPMPWSVPIRGEVFQKGESAILVAWSEDATPHSVALAVSPNKTPQVRDPMFAKSNLASLSGKSLIVRSVPVYVTGLGSDFMKSAYASIRDKRLSELREAYGKIDVSIPESLSSPLSNDDAVGLLKAALDAYPANSSGQRLKVSPSSDESDGASASASRGAVLTAVYRLMKLWDAEILSHAANDPVSGLTQANAALNGANRAEADFRAEVDHREGSRGYQQDTRLLLNLVEKRLYLGRVGLRQKDYPLACARAGQMTAASEAILPYVNRWPIGEAGSISRKKIAEK